MPMDRSRSVRAILVFRALLVVVSVFLNKLAYRFRGCVVPLHEYKVDLSGTPGFLAQAALPLCSPWDPNAAAFLTPQTKMGESEAALLFKTLLKPWAAIGRCSQ